MYSANTGLLCYFGDVIPDDLGQNAESRDIEQDNTCMRSSQNRSVLRVAVSGHDSNMEKSFEVKWHRNSTTRALESSRTLCFQSL